MQDLIKEIKSLRFKEIKRQDISGEWEYPDYSNKKDEYIGECDPRNKITSITFGCITKINDEVFNKSQLCKDYYMETELQEISFHPTNSRSSGLVYVFLQWEGEDYFDKYPIAFKAWFCGTKNPSDYDIKDVKSWVSEDLLAIINQTIKRLNKQSENYNKALEIANIFGVISYEFNKVYFDDFSSFCRIMKEKGFDNKESWDKVKSLNWWDNPKSKKEVLKLWSKI